MAATRPRVHLECSQPCVGADAFRPPRQSETRRAGCVGRSLRVCVPASDCLIARRARNPRRNASGATCLILCDLSRSHRIPSAMKVNIAEKFSKVTELWKPYVVAELNG